MTSHAGAKLSAVVKLDRSCIPSRRGPRPGPVAAVSPRAGDCSRVLTRIGWVKPPLRRYAAGRSTPPARQNGSLEGRGPERNPYVVRVSDSPRFGVIDIGAIVRTSGGSIAGESLAPADLLIGTVLKRIEQAGSGGDSYEIRPAASFGSLDFVAVLPLPAG